MQTLKQSVHSRISKLTVSRYRLKVSRHESARSHRAPGCSIPAHVHNQGQACRLVARTVTPSCALTRIWCIRYGSCAQVRMQPCHSRAPPRPDTTLERHTLLVPKTYTIEAHAHRVRAWAALPSSVPVRLCGPSDMLKQHEPRHHSRLISCASGKPNVHHQRNQPEQQVAQGGKHAASIAGRILCQRVHAPATPHHFEGHDPSALPTTAGLQPTAAAASAI